ncbi:hypothetical protein [Gordonia soli]|uniref:CSD domain-containing protein n=1 Tax=Gordonia soli NBRC 108243 TaxID=1223545 RepID=M0QI27_9ACTN|nr:hypothetical protein [Gordonia soli]GAC68203.1 hypothetical protein GS4_14_00320 [Gordonia soli NBRC 108243]
MSDESRRTPAGFTSGVVRFQSDEGWGVIDSEVTPGGCWFFYAQLWAGLLPTLRPGQSMTISGVRRTAIAGEGVDFTWEHADQDGYAFRAIDVRPRRPHPDWTVTVQDGPNPAFRTSLTLTLDEQDQSRERDQST